MSVHYKFKSALEYDTVTFDGLHISVKDLKNAIVQQKRIGKNTDFDLQVTNAQTKEVYDDDNTLIPKNTSLLIARIPTSVQNKSKNWEGYGGDSTPPSKMDEAGPIAKAVDLSSIDAPEDDKIKAMMSQSTQDYDPSNYMKIRGANQMGAVPSNYRCYKCHQTGHWIKDCPLGQGPDPIEIKKSTGIPRSFMVPVEGPQVQGAMMTPNGSYAVPVLDHQAYTQKSAPAAPAMPESKPEIPEDLLCSICSDLLTDAVMIPCCGNSFCDECIRSCLLESEEHECPDCHEKDISPGTLIPNRFLRNSVANFKNTTGYVKKPVYKEKIKRKQEIEVKEDVQPPPVSNNTQKMKSEMEEKTVISEADSTEPIKTENVVDVKESNVGEEVKNESNELISDGPPGVSPKTSPQENKIANRVNPTDVREHTSRSSSNSKSRPPADLSPRKTQKTRKSPNYNENEQEDRPGTPTVDEPGMGNYHPPSSTYRNAPPAPGTIPSMMNLNPTPIQGPPPATTNYPPPPMGTFPPPHGPPPNFRLPPPGTAPPYMPPGNYPVPPRPMFDASRPPIAGIPPGFPPNYAAGSRPPHQSRDYSNRRLRDRTPPGIIDDPLAAFNKMLREKDERERRLKARQIRRSYSRSPSRGRSYSRSPRPRMRSRSPRRRQTPRSRSRSFTLSRSRSRSYSGGSIRGSPYRQMSPPSRRSPPPRRGGPSRYRSPIRSPPRHHRGDMRGRDFDYDRPYGGRGGDKDRYHHRDDRDRSRDRDRDRDRGRDNRYYDNYDDRGSSNNSRSGQQQQQQQWNQSQQIGGQSGGRDGGNGSYYPEMQQSNYQTNRYSPRDYHQYMGKTEPAPPPPIAPHPMVTGIQPPVRRFDDIAPPGVEEPPVPGLETVPPRFERFETPVVSEKVEEVREKEIKTTEKGGKRKHDKRSRTPTRNPSPARKKSRSKERERDRENDDKHKKARKRDHSDEKDEKKRESEEDKNKKSKDKKKRKDKKESEKKRKKDKKEKHKKDDKERKSKEKQVEKVKSEEKVVPEEKTDEVKVEPPKMDLYDDVPMEEINKSFVEVENTEKSENIVETEQKVEEKIEKDLEDEKDILELHTTDIDLKAEFEKSEVLLPMPEKSKWEVEEDVFSQNSPHDSKHDQKIDKSGKVTNEVLKRAENAIFAKAINAIRPIEIKKISTDRAKLYTNEEKPEVKPTVVVANVEQKKVTEAPPTRIPVKDRLGVKVDEDNKHDRNPSRSLSPFSKRGDGGRNFERKVEVERYRRSRSRRRDGREHRRHDYRTNVQKSGNRRSSSKPKGDDRRKKRSRSVSSLDKKDKRRKKEKRTKKEKPVKKVEEEKVEKNVVEEQKPKLTTEKRKPTLDEATFEPDYDLESEPEKDVKVKESKKEEKAEMKESSSSDSSSSSSDDERRKRKHKKHRKKRRKESSSSSSESESESSDEEKEKRRKKHKKKQKKRKKSKHK